MGASVHFGLNLKPPFNTRGRAEPCSFGDVSPLSCYSSLGHDETTTGHCILGSFPYFAEARSTPVANHNASDRCHQVYNTAVEERVSLYVAG